MSSFDKHLLFRLIDYILSTNLMNLIKETIKEVQGVRIRRKKVITL